MEDTDERMLSELQHFCFCRRQWALIHLEQQWAENLRTTEGDLMHRRCHDEAAREHRPGCLILRGLRVRSERLGISGICDVVEFRPSPEGIALSGEEGLWLPAPVEYKHGSAKETNADRLQLCGQALCLEEMLACSIPTGFLFYGETRRREKVALTQELRAETEAAIAELCGYARRGYTPKVKPGKQCSACSLKELCLPLLCKEPSVVRYIDDHLHEEETPCESC